MPRILCSVGGKLSNTADWSVNLNFSVDKLPSLADAQTAANAILSDCGTTSAISKSLNAEDTFAQVRLTGYPAMSGPATLSVASNGDAENGTSSGQASAPQVCEVATLRTAMPGRSYRGRLYWPLRWATHPNGVVSAADQTQLNGTVQGLAQAISTELGAVGTSAAWGVYSKTLGLITPVSTVSVGTRVDTQRRRAEGPETYANFPVT